MLAIKSATSLRIVRHEAAFRGKPSMWHMQSSAQLPSATVSFSNYVMGRSQNVWGADAAEFKPSRWLAADGHTYVKADQFKYPAFNAGRRLCLGMDMANLEMKVVLGTLLRRFDFELVPGQDVRPANALTLQMRNPLNCYVAEKQR